MCYIYDLDDIDYEIEQLIAELKAIREAPLSDFAEPEEEEIPEVDMDSL